MAATHREKGYYSQTLLKAGSHCAATDSCVVNNQKNFQLFAMQRSPLQQQQQLQPATCVNETFDVYATAIFFPIDCSTFLSFYLRKETYLSFRFWTLGGDTCKYIFHRGETHINILSPHFRSHFIIVTIMTYQQCDVYQDTKHFKFSNQV